MVEQSRLPGQVKDGEVRRQSRLPDGCTVFTLFTECRLKSSFTANEDSRVASLASLPTQKGLGGVGFSMHFICYCNIHLSIFLTLKHKHKQCSSVNPMFPQSWVLTDKQRSFSGVLALLCICITHTPQR